MLTIRMLLQILDKQIANNIFDLFTYFNLSRITDELGWCITSSDDVLEGVDELLLCSHSMDISDKRLCPNEDLDNLVSTIND